MKLPHLPNAHPSPPTSLRSRRASSSASAAAPAPTSSAWTSSRASSPPSRRASTARSSPSAPRACRSPPTRCATAKSLDEAALAEALRELFDGSDLGKRVRVGVANQRTVLRTLELPPGDRPEGARRGGLLPGPGPGADAAQQRRARLPPARHRRHPRRPAPARRARRRAARHGRTAARAPSAAPA